MAMLLSSVAMLAQSFKVDGINYTITSTEEMTVEIGGGNIIISNSGDLVIPEKVEYNGSCYSVTGIGKVAFFRSSGLTSVTIGKSVTSIGEGAFYDCSSLTSVTIPNSVTSIGSASFANCSSLTSVTIPNSVTSIGSGAFSGCSGLKSVTFHCEEIGSWFSGNSSITDVVIGEEVKSIGSAAFSYCRGLTSVTIGKSVTSIDTYAFENCSLLTNVTFHCKTIERWYGLFGSSLKNVVIGSEVTNIGDGASYRGLTSIIVDENNAIYDSRDDCNAIILTASNTLIAGCMNTVIPNSVTSIGSEAFGGCSGLTSVIIPKSVTSIGSGAFRECIGMTSITIPNTVTSIGSEAFRGCSGLTSMTIPNTVTSIGSEAFVDCSGLTSMTIPNSVTNIGRNAFWNCSSLTSVTIGNSVSRIGSMVFRGCSSLTSIVVDANNALYDSRDNCNAIIESASNTLIAGCKNTVIPNTVTSIGKEAFYSCSGLMSVTIPKSVTSIGRNAFHYCMGLSNVTIGNSVTSIGVEAFYSCSGLTSVTIPKSVTSIGRNAFFNCYGLNKVQSKIREPFAINTDCWDAVHTDEISLYVPIGTKERYEATEGWSVFKNIIEIDNGFLVDDAVYINDTLTRQGATMTLSLKMKNTAAIRGFQFDLYLPEGVTVAKSAKGRILGALSKSRLADDDKHTLTLSEQPDGAIRFLCGSQYDETFEGTDGEVATLMVNIADIIEEGDYDIVLKNIKLSESDIEKYYEMEELTSTLSVVQCVVGDINDDKKVDVSDYIGIANHILGNTPEGFVEMAADVNNDADVDVSDYIGVANIIMTGSIYGDGGSASRNMESNADTDVLTDDNVIYVTPIFAPSGTQAQLLIKMRNMAAIRGFQFELYLPEGVTAAKSSSGNILASLTESRLPEEDEHTLALSELSDGGIRFLCGSLYDETFTGTDGEIATLTVDIAEGTADGNYTICLKKIKLTETNISKFYLTDEVVSMIKVTPLKQGDANGNDEVDEADVAMTVSEILGQNPAKFVKEAADVNCDGVVNILDTATIIDIIRKE